jgi:hypothetical protein
MHEELNAEWRALVQDGQWEIDLGPNQAALVGDGWPRTEVVLTTPPPDGAIPEAQELTVRPVSTTLLQGGAGAVRMTTWIVHEFSPKPAFDAV